MEALRTITGSEHWEPDPKKDEPPICPDKCHHNTQATRTACAIWLVAIDLQNDLAQYSQELQSRNLRTTQAIKNDATLGILTTSEILKQWDIIATINYLPVIELAIETLKAGPMGNSISDILEQLHEVSEQLNGLHAKHIYNFAGELWQRLVTDREERAAHYTRPEIAELLASVAAEAAWRNDQPSGRRTQPHGRGLRYRHTNWGRRASHKAQVCSERRPGQPTPPQEDGGTHLRDGRERDCRNPHSQAPD